MRAPSPGELLDAWERGLTESGVDRALTLLATASPDESREALASLPIGERDRRLLRIRESFFGKRVACIAQCPQCQERIESIFDIDQIRVPESAEASLPMHRLEIDAYTLSFRLPNSVDLGALRGPIDLQRARAKLLGRCITSVECDSRAVELDDVPEKIVEAVIERMDAIDQQASIRLGLECPACGHSWTSLFDIVSFFWGELHNWARRTLREIHQLARAYGWSETEILKLSAVRRSIYLQLSQS
jgi:uncharacterized protein (UPF0212 family)